LHPELNCRFTVLRKLDKSLEHRSIFGRVMEKVIHDTSGRIDPLIESSLDARGFRLLKDADERRLCFDVFKEIDLGFRGGKSGQDPTIDLAVGLLQSLFDYRENGRIRDLSALIDAELNYSCRVRVLS
jgi:hypothetical protein